MGNSESVAQPQAPSPIPSQSQTASSSQINHAIGSQVLPPSKSPAEAAGGAGAGGHEAREGLAKQIRLQDNAVRSRVRIGSNFQMKVVIRGAPRTGKTALWRRFQGLSFTPTYTVTPEIQIASIQWRGDDNHSSGGGGDAASVSVSSTSSDETVKVEVWDCVDKGTGLSTGIKNTTPPPTSSYTPASGGAPMTGKHSFAPLDTSIVDVYKGAHAVIFTVSPFDLTSLHYVKELYTQLPMDLPVLILLCFRDQISGKGLEGGLGGGTLDGNVEVKVTMEHVQKLVNEIKRYRDSNTTSSPSSSSSPSSYIPPPSTTLCTSACLINILLQLLRFEGTLSIPHTTIPISQEGFFITTTSYYIYTNDTIL